MYKQVIFSTLLLASSVALATKAPPPFNGGDSSAVAASSAASWAQSQAIAGSSSMSALSSLTTSTLNSSNDSAIIISNEQGGTSFEDYTPNAFAPTIQPTAPCYVGAGIGIGVPGFSGSLGGAYYDKECEVRETVRLAQTDSNHIVRALASQVLYTKLISYLEEPVEEEIKKDRDNTTYWYFE